MTRREREFVILFNALWYRDFPIIKDFFGFGTRAGWTLHIASAVREAANLMGLFMTFETGGRTDGEIHMFDENADGERQTWAKVEWEWNQATRPNVNEFSKLRSAADDARCQIAVFFGRYRTERLDELRNIVSAHWEGATIPLVCFFLEINGSKTIKRPGGNRRVPIFGSLSTYRFAPNNNGTITQTRLRRQPAYPWDVKGTKWAAHKSTELPISSAEMEDED